MTWSNSTVKHGGSCPHAHRSLDEGQGMGRLKKYIKDMKATMEDMLVFIDVEDLFRSGIVM